MDERAPKITLRLQGDQVLLRRHGEDVETAVKVVWARPITTRGGEIAILTQDQKELFTLPDLAALDAESRKAAEADLARRYIFPRILRVKEATADFGIHYWRVETESRGAVFCHAKCLQERGLAQQGPPGSPGHPGLPL